MKKNCDAITVKDLAEMCGVSRGTVDRALNNRGGISEATKKLILDTVKEHNFIKNQNAQSLSKGHTPLIGVILFSLDNEFFSTLATSIEKEAFVLGYSMIVMLSGYSREKELECIEKMTAMNVTGLIVCSVMNDSAPYEKLISRGISVVSLLNRVEGLPFVGIDDFAAMYEGTRYVISCGYKKLYYISPVLSKGGTQNIGAQYLRYQGFKKAIENDGKSKVDYYVIDNYVDYNQKLPKLRNESDCAVICSSDSYTIKCISLLGGTKVGIMGFDRLKTLEILYPMQSGVQCPTEKIGSRAVQFLLSVNDPGNTETNIILPFKIMYGNSV